MIRFIHGKLTIVFMSVGWTDEIMKITITSYERHGALTHWGRDKMTAISQMTLSNVFSWMKMLEFRIKFHWSLFIRIQLTIFQHWIRWWPGADQATSHYLNQWWLDYRRIYASLGLNELNLQQLNCFFTDFFKLTPKNLSKVCITIH